MISDESVAVRLAESPPENDPWPAIMADPQLANARRKLSIHEIRLIIAHVRRCADAPKPETVMDGILFTMRIVRGKIRIAELKAKTEPGNEN